jgi:SAM-dependent methyltransferase
MQVGSERQIQRWSKLKHPELKSLKCYICDYEDDISKFQVIKANDIFNAGELIRYKCPQCEVIFGDLRFLNLSREEINNDYTDLYSYYKEGDTTPYILQPLRECGYLDKSKSILDYACGEWNNVIPILRNEGYDITGYDKFVGKYNTLPNKQFDIVYNNNYIEHLINPLEDLKEILDLVKSGGLAIFLSSCFEYCIEYTHYHTFFFGDKSLDIICKKLNLELIYTNKIVFSNNIFNIVKVFKKL